MNCKADSPANPFIFRYIFCVDIICSLNVDSVAILKAHCCQMDRFIIVEKLCFVWYKHRAKEVIFVLCQTG